MRRASLALVAVMALAAAVACIASVSGKIDEKTAPIFGAQLPY